MNDPLEGLDAQEREWLTKIADSEGLTLEAARERRDQMANALGHALHAFADQHGAAWSDISAELEAGERAADFVRRHTGVNVKGRYGLALYAETGGKVRAGNALGHAEVHGSQEEKQARWTDYQARLEEKLRRNTSLSVTQARKIVAHECGVSLKTIQRHTKNPKR